ncbi:UPF0104 family protein [Roseobacter denitrificans]|uniref:Uncharacterized protein n=1 Tax=Roseobacter denitrificans (strain ATCC 33942 / OCh 114) TaxID=375451 RepID=Q167C2_ROSDO|nr:lysylphosphatidylglycerol synthase transmembrane domain-containing protein [Roseobacter denitrificans]ABG31921.1 conserved hypothetical protein [Roseobacter denitrificans OCh 114]AVL51464.1 UPF0104 family protein [Roseobacter denitrificans]SFG48203.1 Uncharacterized membrane protein YbhN, UPF0104 family [Roseobacter denitrificans OCh 114]
MRWFVKLATSSAVMAALLWWTDPVIVANQLRGADARWLFAALASLTLLTALMAWRWQHVAQAFDIRISFTQAWREYYIAQLANMALPGGVVGDVGRAYRIRRQGDLVRAAQSVAAERLIGQISIFALMAAGFSCALMIPGGAAWPVWTWLAIAAYCIAMCGAVVFARGTSASARFMRLTLVLLKAPRMIGLALVITALLIFSFYACARATQTVIPLADLATLVPLILCAMLIPLSVGGLGWREGAAAALFPLIGASPGAGIAAGIAYGAVMLLAALPAVLLALKPTQTHPIPHTSKMDVL